jgi:hypothetical protein
MLGLGGLFLSQGRQGLEKRLSGGYAVFFESLAVCSFSIAQGLCRRRLGMKLQQLRKYTVLKERKKQSKKKGALQLTVYEKDQQLS